MSLRNDLNIIQMRDRGEGKVGEKGRPIVCTSHIPDFIVRVPRDANALRAFVGHDVGNINTSCLKQTYNQPRRSCEGE